ncbi:MAG: hypothetical protein R3F11_15600 [Verrucomicrobiales bacterium]
MVEHAVPLAAEIKRAQAERLGIDPLMVQDDPVFDRRAAKPQGDEPWMEDRAAECSTRWAAASARSTPA